MKKNWKETLKLWLGALLMPFAVVAEAVGTGCKKLHTLPKKVMALCVAAALIVAMVPAYVFAAETTEAKWAFGTAETAPDDSAYTYSGTLAEAFTAANGNEDTTNTVTYVKLNKDVSMTHTSSATALTLNEGKAMVLDMNSKTYSSSTTSTSGGDATYGIKTEPNSLLTVKNGTISVSSSNDGYAIGIQSKGNLNVLNCTIGASKENANSGAYGIYYTGGVATITNCTITATSVGDRAQSIDIGTTTPALTIADCTVNAIGGDEAYAFYASEYWGKMEFDVAGTITATCANGAFYSKPTTNEVTVTAGEAESTATDADASVAATYANKYVKIEPACTVTVNYGVDGVDNKEITVTKGDTISLENPVIDGHIFMGWFTDADFTTAFDFDTPITATTTVYAKFADYEGDKTALQDAIDALEADVTELNKLTENGGTIDQINAKISAIESKVLELDALKNKYAEADTALKQELQQELQAADTAIISAITALTGRVDALEDEIDDLQTDVNGNAADIAENAAELAALNTSLTNLSNKLTNEYATKAELTSAINSAKDTINSAIDALTVRVQDLEADLAAANSKVDTNTSDVTALKSDVATLNAWKNEAQSAITALQTLTGTQGTDIANLKLAVQSLEAELAAANARIDAAEDRIAALEGKVSALEIAKQNLDAAVAALNAAINNKADTATLNQKVTDLIAAIAAAEDAAKTYADGKDTALQTQLTAAIATAKGEAITAAENLVNTAKAELQTAINNKADIATLNAKVSELNAAIATAEATAKAYTDSAVTTLNAAIITAKDEAVDAAKDLVDAAKAQLQAAIDNKADTAAVNAAIANLQNAITALQNAKDNYIAADAALKAELEAAIAKAKKEAIDAAKGHIPYIGTNGNWWIGDTDTGVDANGIAGNKGDKGDTGADGVGIAKIEKTATNGNVDTYTVTLTNGKTYTFTVTNGKDGADGKDGTDGKDGENGKDGLTPFIGENGNWWIGDTDTGVKAVAEQTAQKGTDTITVVSIVVASVALLSNLALVVWIVTKKKKVLV